MDITLCGFRSVENLKNSITLCPGVAVEETQTRKNKNFLGDSNR